MFLQTLIHTIKHLNTTINSKEFTTFLHKINPEIHLSLHLILNCSPQFSPLDQSHYFLRYKVRPLARLARRTANGDWSLTRASSSATLNKWAGWFTDPATSERWGESDSKKNLFPGTALSPRLCRSPNPFTIFENPK